MKLKIKDFIANNGERFTQLYDVDVGGFPLFYPTAYITRKLRSGYAHNTQKDQLQAIKKLYEWADAKNIDLHQKLWSKNFLQSCEIDSLTNNLKLKHRSKNGESISLFKFNAHLSVIARFIQWYSAEIFTDANNQETSAAIDRMSQSILSNKVKQGSLAKQALTLLTKKFLMKHEKYFLSCSMNHLKELKALQAKDHVLGTF